MENLLHSFIHSHARGIHPMQKEQPRTKLQNQQHRCDVHEHITIVHRTTLLTIQETCLQYNSQPAWAAMLTTFLAFGFLVRRLGDFPFLNPWSLTFNEVAADANDPSASDYTHNSLGAASCAPCLPAWPFYRQGRRQCYPPAAAALHRGWRPRRQRKSATTSVLPSARSLPTLATCTTTGATGHDAAAPELSRRFG